MYIKMEEPKHGSGPAHQPMEENIKKYRMLTTKLPVMGYDDMSNYLMGNMSRAESNRRQQQRDEYAERLRDELNIATARTGHNERGQ